MVQTSPRQCIFCDNNANSREHFWPGWIHDLLPKPPDPRHDRKFFTYHPQTGLHEKGTVSGRQGALHTIAIQAVCVTCNNGWMERLESAVRPLLTPLITRSPVALDFEQMSIIARWATLKCIVAEHTTSGTWMTPRADRIAFKADGVIPSYFSLYLANHNMKGAAGYMRHTLDLRVGTPEYDPPLDGATCNVETISFVLGHVFVHLNAARIANFDIESRYTLVPFHGQCRIWPFQHHEMVWPRRPWFDREVMTKIANTLEDFTVGRNITYP